LMQDLQGPISLISDYDNIRAVFPENSNRQIPEFPMSRNPSAVISGSRLFITPDYAAQYRPFRVIPPGNAINVVVHARQTSPLPFDDGTTVYIDNLLLQYDAAWMYCVDDGTVPAQVNKFQMLAAKRRKQLRAALAQQPLLLDPRFASDMNAWDTSYFVLDMDPLA
jgi:hypothetical protein